MIKVRRASQSLYTTVSLQNDNIIPIDGTSIIRRKGRPWPALQGLWPPHHVASDVRAESSPDSTQQGKMQARCRHCAWVFRTETPVSAVAAPRTEHSCSRRCPTGPIHSSKSTSFTDPACFRVSYQLARSPHRLSTAPPVIRLLPFIDRRTIGPPDRRPRGLRGPVAPLAGVGAERFINRIVLSIVSNW